MQRPAALLVCVMLCSALRVGLCSDKPAEPSPDAVLALADKYITQFEPRLEDHNKKTIDNIKSLLKEDRDAPDRLAEAIGGLVNQMTVALAGMKSLDALVVGSAYLVRYAPDGPWATNLFGAVLHAGSQSAASGARSAVPDPKAVSYGSLADAQTVLEYTLKLAPDSSLIMVNLANLYFDLDRDGDAKKLLDRVVFLDAKSRAGHKGLALYWYRRADYGNYRRETLKASEFGGFVHKAKARQAETVEEDAVKPEDPIETIEGKLDKLQDSVPLSTADVIEDEYPEVARQVREQYGKLSVIERVTMPPLPVVDTSTPKAWTQNSSIIDQWGDSFGDNAKRFLGGVMGVDTGASEAVQDAQARAAAKAALADALKLAQQQAEAMRNMPGIGARDLAELAASIEELKQTAREEGIGGADETAPPKASTGGDSGGLFSDSNWCAYERIYRSYLAWSKKYWEKYASTIDPILEAYRKKVAEENKAFDPIWAKLQEEEREERLKNPPDPKHRVVIDRNGNDICLHCRPIELGHRRRLNAIAEACYQQWVNMYMTQYAQKMKPRAEGFWYVCTLYIKNMSDPEVAKREYEKMAVAYTDFAGKAVGAIGVGDAFVYSGSTEEDERALAEATAASQEQAKARKPEFDSETVMPERGWSDWIHDHFSAVVDAQFLALKITGKSIELEAWYYGPTGRLKWDYLDGKVETYSGITGKWSHGIEIAEVAEVKVKAKLDVYGRYSKWDFENGKFSEGWQPGGSGEAKIGLGPVSVAGQVRLDSELHARTALKGSIDVLKVGDGNVAPKLSTTFTW